MAQIIFILILLAGTWFFTRNVRRIARNIHLGRPLNRNDRKGERWQTMLRVAFGQSKMTARPVAAILHFFVYAGFIIINIEVLEILIDGVAGTHRVFAPAGSLYNALIALFEVLALLVLAGCVIFLLRRNLLRLKRFWSREMTSWPRSDANIILITEIALMTAFLTMNAADSILQGRSVTHYIHAGAFPVSSWLAPALSGMSDNALVGLERFCWWFHIVFILVFLNYIPYSKHFHIVLAFPNTYYSNLEKKGKLTNMDTVTQEVKLMLDPSVTPPADYQPPVGFGAADVYDLTWKNLMDAYTCTECGRCTSVCPASQTGKLLSPRKIMMDTRDRLEEVGRQLDQKSGESKKERINDGKSLFSYITEEELWACTSCNACTEACPVNIDPLNIIVEMRRYLVMEKSSMPAEIQAMLTKIENNGAPWQFAQADRLKWADGG